MHADQLRVAVDKVVNTLTASGVLTAIRDYRSARGDQSQVAAARLGHAGAMLMEGFARASSEEVSTLQLLHLHNLRETAYWNELLGPHKSEPQRASELVHMYSRVLFATNHLPNFAALLARSNANAPGAGAAPALPIADLRPGESRITVRLTDAGERASDPDRIARSIDGIDMLYSACASLSRRPAMDLRLDHIIGTVDRTIVFTGESDSISAMAAVIDSIPETLASLNDDQEIDLDELVDSLPIFEQLSTFARHGAFSENDLKDIRETMHQGALLALESGVVMPQPPLNAAQAQQRANQNAGVASGVKSSFASNVAAVRASAQSPSQAQPHVQSAPAPAQSNSYAAQQNAGAASSEPFRDEHYERYLKERQAMQSGGGQAVITSAPDDPFPMLDNAVSTGSGASRNSDLVDADQQSAIDELLNSLNRQRDA